MEAERWAGVVARRPLQKNNCLDSELKLGKPAVNLRKLRIKLLFLAYAFKRANKSWIFIGSSARKIF